MGRCPGFSSHPAPQKNKNDQFDFGVFLYLDLVNMVETGHLTQEGHTFLQAPHCFVSAQTKVVDPAVSLGGQRGGRDENKPRTSLIADKLSSGFCL